MRRFEPSAHRENILFGFARRKALLRMAQQAYDQRTNSLPAAELAPSILSKPGSVAISFRHTSTYRETANRDCTLSHT